MKRTLILVLLILGLLLAGCLPTKRIEEIGIITARGVDVSENDQLAISLVIFQFEAQSSTIAKVVKGKGDTIKGAIDNANYESNFMLDVGKLQVDLYGMEVAKNGISPYIDSISRDPNLPDTMYLAISDTTAKEIIEIQESGIAINIGQYLQGLIETNSVDHLFPKVSLVDFSRIKNDVGIDPILPIIEIKEGIPKITKIAILKDDTYVGELPIKRKDLLNFVNGKVKDELMELSLPKEPFEKYLNGKTGIDKEDINIAYTILKNKSKTRLINKESMAFETQIDLSLNLLELEERLDVENPKVLKLLEKEIEKKLKSQYENMLAKLQELNADPLGYGAVFRMNKKDGKLKKSEWRAKYPDIEVEFKIDADMIRHGEINK